MWEDIINGFDIIKEYTLGGLVAVSVLAITCWTRFNKLVKTTAKHEVDRAIHEQHMQCQLESIKEMTQMRTSLKYIEDEIGKMSGNPRNNGGDDNDW